MKNILAKLFGATGGNIAEKISGIIDKHTFSKVEKAQFEKEMQDLSLFEPLQNASLLQVASFDF